MGEDSCDDGGQTDVVISVAVGHEHNSQRRQHITHTGAEVRVELTEGPLATVKHERPQPHSSAHHTHQHTRAVAVRRGLRTPRAQHHHLHAPAFTDQRRCSG